MSSVRAILTVAIVLLAFAQGARAQVSFTSGNLRVWDFNGGPVTQSQPLAGQTSVYVGVDVNGGADDSFVSLSLVNAPTHITLNITGTITNTNGRWSIVSTFTLNDVGGQGWRIATAGAAAGIIDLEPDPGSSTPGQIVGGVASGGSYRLRINNPDFMSLNWWTDFPNPQWARTIGYTLTLDANMPFVAYYPEGFASNAINEFVPITNHGSQPVLFELHARYEIGDRDQLITSGVIPPTTRGGYTVCEINHPQDVVVRRDEPYALVLKASAPVSATMSHYDFGTALGESFTTTTSDEWTFAEGFKDPATTRDFFLVYNPSDSPVDVIFDFYLSGGAIVTKSITLQAQRRGGLAVNDIPEVVTGAYSVHVAASAPIVAVISHYNQAQGRGFGAAGTPGQGATDGMIPIVSYRDDFYDINGDQGGPRFEADALISMLNTDPTFLSVVTMTFVREDGGTFDRIEILMAGSRKTISLRSLGMPVNTDCALVYRATRPVTLSGSRYQGMDATGVQPSTVAATTWDFAEGYMHRARAGTTILETIYLFNPQQGRADVTLTFASVTGQTLTHTLSLAANEYRPVRLHALQPLLDWAEEQWYGVRVASTGPIVALLDHWDSSNGGGFNAMGMPSGTVVSFRDAQTLPGLDGIGELRGGPADRPIPEASIAPEDFDRLAPLVARTPQATDRYAALLEARRERSAASPGDARLSRDVWLGQALLGASILERARRADSADVSTLAREARAWLSASLDGFLRAKAQGLISRGDLAFEAIIRERVASCDRFEGPDDGSSR